MIQRQLFRVFLAVIFSFGITVPALAGEATEGIRQITDKIITLLSDPALKAPEKKAEKRRMIREAVDERFDWEEISRRSLARHWRKRTDAEKKEFIKLFGKLLERTYMDKVEHYSGEKVQYLDEKIDGNYGVVKVKIVTDKNIDIPVDYRVIKKGNEWYVYDISIQGISLVNNYRVQFRDILRKSSYKDLIKRLKDKIAQE